MSIISDENGFFELVPEQFSKKDSLFISSMGFESKQFSLIYLMTRLLDYLPKLFL